MCCRRGPPARLVSRESHAAIRALDGSPWALLDADTGAEILPLDFWDIVAIPGEAVYVRTPVDRLRLPGRTEPASEAWKRLDVHTGELLDTDVAWAGAADSTMPGARSNPCNRPPAARQPWKSRNDPSPSSTAMGSNPHEH